MISEQIMNRRRIELLKIIRKENPSLRSYMTDLLNEMEDPESAFNTGRISKLSDLDRLTAMRLCDAFAVAKKYSEKYHLDLPELIEFVSEKTLEIIAEDSESLVTPFKNKLSFLIYHEFPFRNPLFSRSNRQNMEFYLEYDRDNKNGCIDENGQYYNGFSNENAELNIPILFTKNSNIACIEIKSELEIEEASEQIQKELNNLAPMERNIIRLRFGFDDGITHDLDEVGRRYEMPRERIRQIEAHAIRKLHSRKLYSKLRTCEFLYQEDVSYTPIGRVIDYTIGAPVMDWPLKHEYQHASQCKYNVRCICGGKVVFECANNQKILICQNCGKIYPVETKRQIDQ